MPDTARLYALNSTSTHPFLTGEDGPALLIHDPNLAMRWYLTHEQENNYAVTVQASDDGGRTWHPLPVHDLLTDTEHALAADSQASLQREALTGLAATWLDGRIRYTPADDPTGWQPGPPEPAAWRRGGQAWALAMNTAPPDALLERLTARYTTPHPDGPHLLRDAAAQTLTALTLADTPVTADVAGLLHALALLERLTYAAELGQLRDRADRAQHQLLHALTPRVLLTATAVAAHPDPHHPVHAAAHAYLRQLARTGPRPRPEPAARALERAGQALADAAATPDAPGVPAADTTVPGTEPPVLLPGFPVQFTDLEAAAAWRALSPLARRDAATAMQDLVRADLQVLTAAAAAAAWDGNQPRDPGQAAAFDRLRPLQQHLQAEAAHTGQDHARDNRRYFQDRLDDLTAGHALLMHAAVLHDAEQAAITARHRVVIAASDATLAPAHTPRTAGDAQAEHDAFLTYVSAAEERIDHVLHTQRQITRDALQRLFPRHTRAEGLYALRTRLLDHSGLGPDGYHHARQQIHAAARALEELQADFAGGQTPFGRPAVTEEDITRARDRGQRAEQDFSDLQESRRATLIALNTLDTVADLAPSPPGTVAERVARIAAQSRRRTQPAPAHAPAHEPRTSTPAPAQQHTQHAHPAQHSPAVRPT